MCRTGAKISSLFEHETLKKKKKRRKNGREPIIQTSDFSTGPLIRGARLLAPREIHARASVSRATAARPPDRHFLPRHVASCGRARRICTSHERRTSSTVPPSPPPLSSLQSARIGGPRGDLRNVAISPGRFFRLHNLFLSYLPHLDPTAISISFRPPPLPPFRSQFLRERTALRSPRYAPPFLSFQFLPRRRLRVAVVSFSSPLEISFVQISQRGLV